MELILNNNIVKGGKGANFRKPLETKVHCAFPQSPASSVPYSSKRRGSTWLAAVVRTPRKRNPALEISVPHRQDMIKNLDVCFFFLYIFPLHSGVLLRLGLNI